MSSKQAAFSPQPNDFIPPERIRQIQRHMIDVARIARGLTQEQLAQQTGMQQALINKLINGKIFLTSDYIERIADATGFPVSFFDEEVSVLPNHIVYYRKYKSLSSLELTKTQYNLHINRHRIKKLLAAVNLPNKLVTLQTDSKRSPEEIANLIRLKWGMPRGPITNLMRYLEAAGIVVLLTNQEVEHFDGLVLPDEHSLPVICINRNLSPDRLRYNLAHELGHLIMHTNDYFPEADDDFEAEANRFASEFLMPKDDILPYFEKDLPITQLTSLKAYWKVSMAAIVRRAYTLKAIEKSRYTSLNVQLSKLGYKKKEPTCGLVTETPTLFGQLLKIHTSKLEYSFDDLAKLLCISPIELRELYSLYSPSLFTVTKNEDPNHNIGGNRWAL